jgi:branched-chain amino acid transport system ATP-binding protein
VRSVFLSQSDKTRTAWAGERPIRTRPRAAVAQPLPPEPALAVHRLSKTYGGIAAVRDVDLTVDHREIIGVIGANGAGKSTLFDIVSGMIRSDTGTVRMHGRDITTWSPAARARAGLGRTFQDLRLVPSMTVPELLTLAYERAHALPDSVGGVLALSASLRAEAEILVKVEELMDSFGLTSFHDTFISELSTGSRRIVELACAAAHSPSVLILDEPSSGLAQREAEAMVDLLLDVKERTGASLAIIEHDIPVIRRLCDTVVCMHLGGVIARGPADDILTDPKVISSYLGVDDLAVERSGKRTRPHRPRKREPKLRPREST